MPNVSFAPQFTAGALGIWSLVVIVLVALVKAWPAIKAKVNEARKIELDADDKLQAKLFGRIDVLEAQVRAERKAGDDRHAECEHELRDVRLTLEGVVRQFLAYQMAAARAIPLTNMSPEMTEALTSLRDLIDTRKDDK
jgi:hypothetical protein